MAIRELKDRFIKSNCVTILTDASNQGSQKIFPVLVRFFCLYEGTHVKVLEFQWEEH